MTSDRPNLERNSIRGGEASASLAQPAALRGGSPPTNNKKRILSTLIKWIDPTRSGDFNQALMELGSTVCMPKNPKCENCPLNPSCCGTLSGNPESYPSPKTQKSLPWQNVLTGVIWKNDSFLILKRSGYKHLNNLWELPGGKTLTKNKPHPQLAELLKNKYKLDVAIKNK